LLAVVCCLGVRDARRTRALSQGARSVGRRPAGCTAAGAWEDYSSFTALSFSSGAAAEAEPSSFIGSPSPTLSEGSTLEPTLPGLSEGSTRFLLIEVFSFLKLHHALVAWEGKCSVA